MMQNYYNVKEEKALPERKNLNNNKTLGFLAAIIGITFFIMVIFIHLEVAIETSTGVFKVNQNLKTPYFLLGITSTLFAISGFWLNHNASRKVPKNQRRVYEKCYNCSKELTPSVERVELTRNTSNNEQEQINLCRDCIVKELDKQDGVCPECKKPLKWNGNLRDFFGEWYHPKCVFELQKGRSTKEVKETREVIVKFRCPYCKYIYDEGLDKCPHCGGKRT